MDTVETRNYQTIINKTNGINCFESADQWAALDFVTSLMPQADLSAELNITKIRYT